MIRCGHITVVPRYDTRPAPSGTPGAVSSTGTFDRDLSEEEGGKVGDHVDGVWIHRDLPWPLPITSSSIPPCHLLSFSTHVVVIFLCFSLPYSPSAVSRSLATFSGYRNRPHVASIFTRIGTHSSHRLRTETQLLPCHS